MSDQDKILAAIEKIRDVYSIYGMKQGDFVEALADLNKKAEALLVKTEDKTSDQDKILKAIEKVPRCRGMTISTKKYGGKWVYGYAWVTNYNTQEYVVFNDGQPRCHIIEPSGTISEVDPETLGQFILQKDDHGNNIYEGDWVLCDRYSTHERIEVQVRSIKAIPSLMFGSSLNSREVVGNIYETGGEGDGKN